MPWRLTAVMRTGRSRPGSIISNADASFAFCRELVPPFLGTSPGGAEKRDGKHIRSGVQVISYMKRNHIIALLTVGIVACLNMVVTYQWVVMLIIVAVVALILVASDVAGRTGV